MVARELADPGELTPEEPAKPTLSTSFSSSDLLEALDRGRAVRLDQVEDAVGRPPAMNSRASASPSAGEYSAGFTTAFPQDIALEPGTNQGTATWASRRPR